MNFIPTIIEVNHEGERHYDVYSLLLKDRIIMLMVKSMILWRVTLQHNYYI